MARRIQFNCYVCDLRSPVQQMRRIDREEDVEMRNIAVTRRGAFLRPALDVTERTRLCINCGQSIRREIEAIQQDPDCLRLNVLTQTSSHTCVICEAENDIEKISLECRINVFVVRDIYMPENVRTCRHHLDDRGFFEEPFLLGLRYVNRPYMLSGSQLSNFLQGLRNGIKLQPRRFEDENALTDREFSSLAPVSKEQFRDLFTFCDRVPCEGGYRYVSKRDLLMFLCKMRQGLSDEFLATMFNYSSRQAVSMAVATVRQSLVQRFVPNNIGFDAITREHYIENHVTAFANELYNTDPNTPRVIACIDGTYSYTHKSSNSRVLRQSFSMHKGRHLLKPVLLVAPDGYILDIQGPYFADSRNNDAAILRSEFDRDASKMRAWMQEGDIVIVDRGYRDATEMLARLGITWHMPALLPRGQSQLTTEEANNSRIVTKTRWIVEARNGHIKSIFKFLDQTIQIIYLPNLGDFYRIAGAIINKYHPMIHMEGATVDLARNMLDRAKNDVNGLKNRVEREQLGTRNAQRWVRLNAAQIPDFPVLTLHFLRSLTIGVFQVNLAPSYIQDKMRQEEGDYFDLEMLRDVDQIPQPGLLRMRIRSRYRNQKTHQLWISYRPMNGEGDGADPAEDQPIDGYYCTCYSGARTVGTCAHVTSVLWFLGYARHEENVRYPSDILIETIGDAGNR